VLTFSPSGTNTGVTVTRPTAPGDSETPWRQRPRPIRPPSRLGMRSRGR
jgi:hypothetical protein